MKATGIIVEYNPFHNGHKYHLEKAKEQGNVVIAVMSGDYVQRGEPAIINRWSRAEMALKNGVDIVIELPVFYSCQSAEIFARGAIGILEILKVESIVFGSEEGNIEKLESILSLEETKEFKEKLLDNLKKGNSYPTSYGKALECLQGDLKLLSNDILALEYMRAIKRNKSFIKGIPLKREKVGYHEKKSCDNIMSATGIREKITKKEDYKDYIPEASNIILEKEIFEGNISFLEKYYDLIRYEILNNRDSLNEIQDIEIGYENKLYESAMKYNKFEDFYNSIISKRMTIGRVQRILIHILINLTKQITVDVKNKVPYVRVMGFNKKGQEYLRKFKEDRRIIIGLKNIQKKLSDDERILLEFNEKASIIYKMKNFYEDKKIPIIIGEEEC